MPATKTSETTQIVVNPIDQRTIRVAILGTQPLILNRQAEKAKRELLLPSGRKTTADRAANLKHDPLAEYRASPYVLPEDDAPTALAALSAWFKGAMMTASLDLPGTKRTQIGRLLWVEGQRVPLWGVPELFMSVTRSADINRTPDIRTRAIVPEWAVELDISFVSPLLNERSVINLLAAAGLIAGVGDWRPEKGKGTFGQFTLVNPDDARVQAIKARGDRAAQLAALREPGFYDAESEELFAWFRSQVEARGKSGLLTSLAAD